MARRASGIELIEHPLGQKFRLHVFRSKGHVLIVLAASHAKLVEDLGQSKLLALVDGFGNQPADDF